MSQTEKVGWICMTLGLIITMLPFIPTTFYGISFNSGMIVISILGVICFLMGASKALPEVLISVFGNDSEPKDKTSNQETECKDCLANISSKRLMR